MKEHHITPPSIIVSNARLAFDDKIIFQDLNCIIPSSQCTCLLGPSGVGKTSLLKLIGGLVENHHIEAKIKCSDNLPLTNRLAYMPQADVLMPWLNILDNVLIGWTLRGEKPTKIIKDKAVDLLKQVGLENVIKQRPAKLSGGMRQRASLVRILMEDKPVVLLDEPFVNLDSITRMQLQTLTSELLKDKTLLLVTHDPLEALRMGDRIHVMSGQPAHLDKALEPDGSPPRDPGDPEIFIQQREILQRLHLAKEKTL